MGHKSGVQFGRVESVKVAEPQQEVRRNVGLDKFRMGIKTRKRVKGLEAGEKDWEIGAYADGIEWVTVEEISEGDSTVDKISEGDRGRQKATDHFPHSQ